MTTSLRVSSCIICGSVFAAGERGRLPTICSPGCGATRAARVRWSKSTPADRVASARKASRARWDRPGARTAAKSKWAGGSWVSRPLHGPHRPCRFCGQFVERRDKLVCNAGDCRRQMNNERMRGYLVSYRRTPQGKASKRRRDARRKAAKRGVVQVDYDPADIFARDRWVCQICHRKVDRRLVVPHRMAPTIDHIVPLALGGADAPWNVQLAHLSCNSSKRAGAANDQLRLAV